MKSTKEQGGSQPHPVAILIYCGSIMERLIFSHLSVRNVLRKRLAVYDFILIECEDYIARKKILVCGRSLCCIME